MGVIRELRRQARQIVASLLGIAVIGYFAFHAVEGERGLRAYFALNHKTVLVQRELDAVRAERLQLEKRVALLRPSGLDLDMLDERARRILGLVHRDDIVILAPAASE